MNKKNIHIVIPILASIWFIMFCIIMGMQNISNATINLEGIASGLLPNKIENNHIFYAVNAIIIALTAYLLSRLNTIFPLMKEHSYIAMMFFLLLEMLTPEAVTSFSPGNVVALLIYICMFILYSCYQRGDTPQQSFLITLLITTTSLIYARILYFLPLFILGLYQMKALSLRSFIAIIIGLITPFWTAWGMGWIESNQFYPDILLIKPEWNNLGITLLPVCVSIILGLFTGLNNLMNAHTEKIQTRAMNGFVNILSVYTSLLILIDTTHYLSYLPILNMGVSLQVAYYFTSHSGKTSSILFYSITTILIALHAWIFWAI